MMVERITVGFTQTNCYIFGDEKEVVVIDPAADYNKIKKFLAENNLKPKAIINTHGHGDHIGANSNFKLPVWIHELDEEFLTDTVKNLSGLFGLIIKSPPAAKLLKDKDILKVGGLELEVIHTPGHTPGSICLKCGNIIFTGDTLFQAGIGRTDFPYSSEREVVESIKKRLLIYPDAKIYPGHGPSSTIKQEMEDNPFLS